MRFVDADYTGDIDARKSTTGYVFTLVGGLVVCSRSMVQSLVALSMTEVGYMIVAETAKEALWLTGLLDMENAFLRGNLEKEVYMDIPPRYTASSEAKVACYMGIDWVGNISDRKSTSGYFTFVGGNLVTWRSKKQKVVALSSAKAEFRGMTKGLL
ncbi:uncharacterized mitochondrial protein AtMg00810-like [Malania oleifera]|uniref:uncharacterized mitochondrial protein AtMg00810-like n=1 Tax=Malania oleifera TaxID=397392 RepID=UPI0025AEB142|nr:uncharacterized mitochondrial protein AtMg00810-like [Malania oleifera]